MCPQTDEQTYSCGQWYGDNPLALRPYTIKMEKMFDGELRIGNNSTRIQMRFKVRALWAKFNHTPSDAERQALLKQLLGDFVRA